MIAQVSLTQWNQDERFGAFGGPHAMLEGGYGQLLQMVASRLNIIRLGCPVAKVAYTGDEVTVTTVGGDEVKGSAAIVSVPVGVLQRGAITFEPPLPAWKSSAMSKIGMGKLNKVRPEEQHVLRHLPPAAGTLLLCRCFWSSSRRFGKRSFQKIHNSLAWF